MSYSQAKDCGALDALNIYLREIKGDPLLTATEEKTLAEAIARGTSRLGPD